MASGTRLEYGEVFTKRWVAELILDLCDYRPDLDLTKLRVVEPSVGSGAFLGPVLERLLAAKTKHEAGMPWIDLGGCIRCWDLLPEHVEVSRKLAIDLLVREGPLCARIR